MPVAGTDRTVGQTSHRLISEALGNELCRAVHAGPSIADQAELIRYRVSAVLYLLLRDHAIDRRGRCRSCRRPGAVITIRRQPCRILIKARYWLLHPPEDAQLLSLLAAELPAKLLSSSSASQAHRPIHSSPDKQGRGRGRGDTDVLSTHPASRSTEPVQTLAFPSMGPPHSCPGTGRPDSRQN